ncbi:hypothetical protein C8R43DRAFT_1234077 [Mycena crocata]|nr:hypothetical protein C8R43DRAFT_1234077 [Mycena crocata]
MEEPLHRVENLWFEDGGIVIKAQNTLYRVFRGILEQQSPIFADMFSIPQPQNAETIEGLPVAEIPDAAEDVTVFFRAIFDSSFFQSYPATTTFKIMSGVLRLSTKYDVDHLRRRALVHLSSAYPTTLTERDRRLNQYESAVWEQPSWHADGVAGEISVIRLSREVDAPWILPLAFYVLGRRSVSIDIVPETPSTTPRLCQSDQLALLKGSSLQQLASTQILRFLCAPPIAGCTRREICMEAKLEGMYSAFEDLQRFPRIPLNIWAEEDWDRIPELCDVCHENLRDMHNAGRETFWDGLPEMYDLSSWDTLRQMKCAAIGVL